MQRCPYQPLGNVVNISHVFVDQFGIREDEGSARIKVRRKATTWEPGAGNNDGE